MTTTEHAPAAVGAHTEGLRIGTAPDSWGVWFPEHPRQTPWERFLDEVADAGYTYIELGPYGYLPTDPAQLSDELAKRNLKLSGGTIFTGFHNPILNAKGDSLRRRWEGNFAGASAPLVLNVLLDHLQRCSAARARKVRA